MSHNAMRRGSLAIIVVALFGAGLLSGCSTLEKIEIPQPADGDVPTQEAMSDQAEGDYYTLLGEAQHDYEVSEPGVVQYCPLDELERAVCAYGELTSSLRADAQARGRQDITVDPAGWGHNSETDIPGLDDVEGSQDYHGWFWNRSHLVADSLGGSPDHENLVTGTRTQNVGSTQSHGQYAGGMAYTELMARDYLDSGAGDSCPLYYAATPQYTDDELIPRTVIVDIASCDGSINERVEVYNTANGFTIDYVTGAFSAAA